MGLGVIGYIIDRWDNIWSGHGTIPILVKTLALVSLTLFGKGLVDFTIKPIKQMFSNSTTTEGHFHRETSNEYFDRETSVGIRLPSDISFDKDTSLGVKLPSDIKLNTGEIDLSNIKNTTVSQKGYDEKFNKTRNSLLTKIQSILRSNPDASSPQLIVLYKELYNLETSSVSDNIDCKHLSKNKKLRGNFTEREKIDWNVYCKQQRKGYLYD